MDEVKTQSESIDALAAAMSDLQRHVTGAKKDKKNPFFKMSYPTLRSVRDAVREPLADNGLSVIHSMIETDHTYRVDAYETKKGHKIESSERGLLLVTLLMHKSGQWIKSFTPVKFQENNDNIAQAMGSGITYATRYALMAILGIPSEDDDGNSAYSSPPRKQPTKPAPKIDPKEHRTHKKDYPNGVISDAQLKRLHTIASKVKIPAPEVKRIMREMYGIESSKEIKAHQYKDIVTAIEAWGTMNDETKERKLK